MKVDFGQELKTIRGEDLKEVVKTEENPEGVLEVITLGGCAIGALLNPEQGAQGKEKAKRYALAIRIQERGEDEEIELKIEELALIKKLIGKIFNALMVGQCWDMLEEEKKKKAEARERAEAREMVKGAAAAPKTEKKEEVAASQ